MTDVHELIQIGHWNSMCRMARSRKGGNSRLGPLVAVGGGRGADRSRRPGAPSHGAAKKCETAMKNFKNVKLMS